MNRLMHFCTNYLYANDFQMHYCVLSEADINLFGEQKELVGWEYEWERRVIHIVIYNYLYIKISQHGYIQQHSGSAHHYFILEISGGQFWTIFDICLSSSLCNLSLIIS